ncbi:hypothetical protein WOLCODRAFT_21337 [Wolfiporia cocos MD-104 SS10]|uniref:Uncharacterized protein n=1 Tax=Wolfiporia cocos (strain MD-104) TaxID=742152 RepID=A0A2H3J9X9_WOLCO|nr:hypothetical protein WOLCODRAFT_21337 [Wolfiporia cocos MD-104 SS10]
MRLPPALWQVLLLEDDQKLLMIFAKRSSQPPTWSAFTSSRKTPTGDSFFDNACGAINACGLLLVASLWNGADDGRAPKSPSSIRHLSYQSGKIAGNGRTEMRSIWRYLASPGSSIAPY